MEPRNPREKGYCEELNSKLCDDMLNDDIFFSPIKAKIMIEAWRRNTERPQLFLLHIAPALGGMD